MRQQMLLTLVSAMVIGVSVFRWLPPPEDRARRDESKPCVQARPHYCGSDSVASIRRFASVMTSGDSGHFFAIS